MYQLFILMKKLTIAGILLVIFAFVIVWLKIQQTISTTGELQALILPPNTIRYAAFNLTNTTIVNILYYANSTLNNTPLTYLMLNETGFNNAMPYLNSSSSLYAASNSLEGNGALEIIWDSPSGFFPAAGNITGVDYYSWEGSSQLQPGFYYNVFDNDNDTNVTVYYTVVRGNGLASNQILSNSSYWLIGTVMFIGGIIVTLYSIFLMGKPKEKLKEEDVEKMYASYEKKQRRSGKAQAKHRHRRKRSA